MWMALFTFTGRTSAVIRIRPQSHPLGMAWHGRVLRVCCPWAVVTCHLLLALKRSEKWEDTPVQSWGRCVSTGTPPEQVRAERQ